MTELSRILSAIEKGDPQAAARLLPLVYDELRSMAANQLGKEKAGQTLQATALVHEAYLRLIGDQHFKGRRHFFATAAEAMRRILVDRARARLALKRGGTGQRMPIELDQLQGRFTDMELIETHDLLDELAHLDADAAEVVRLHVFAGFSLEEVGDIRGISRATAYREWAFARAWLRDALSSQ
jgi:RNA polymerase sigma factor (TIGR02999 family)